MLSSVARQALRRAPSSQASRAFATAGFPAPRLFDYETVTKNLSVTDAIESVEEAFAALAKGKVDVPMPMHIGIDESAVAGPGDCHIKGGYVSATPTFTVKLACVSFYKNLEAGLPPGSGIFIVVNAVSKFTCFCQRQSIFCTCAAILYLHSTVPAAQMCIVQRK